MTAAGLCLLLGCEPAGTVTRRLVDLNRSLGSPSLFSATSHPLPAAA